MSALGASFPAVAGMFRDGVAVAAILLSSDGRPGSGGCHENRFAELERARCRHLLASRQAVENQHGVADDRTAAHAAFMGPWLTLLVRGDDEHMLATGPLAQG